MTYVPAVEVGDLPRSDPRGKIRHEKTIAFRRVDADEAPMHLCFPGAHMHIRINDAAIQDERFVRQQGIQVGPGEECSGDLSPSEVVDLGLPVVFQPNHVVEAMGIARLEPV